MSDRPITAILEAPERSSSTILERQRDLPFDPAQAFLTTLVGDLTHVSAGKIAQLPGIAVWSLGRLSNCLDQDL